MKSTSLTTAGYLTVRALSTCNLQKQVKLEKTKQVN